MQRIVRLLNCRINRTHRLYIWIRFFTPESTVKQILNPHDAESTKITAFCKTDTSTKLQLVKLSITLLLILLIYLEQTNWDLFYNIPKKKIYVKPSNHAKPTTLQSFLFTGSASVPLFLVRLRGLESIGKVSRCQDGQFNIRIIEMMNLYRMNFCKSAILDYQTHCFQKVIKQNI